MCSERNYSAASYAAYRPVYPEALYEIIMSYHNGPTEQVVDIGTGHGVVARAMDKYFSTVIGVDPSAVMLETANSETPSSTYPNVQFKVGKAETLPLRPDPFLDMVVSGQAAHWFYFPHFWAEMNRFIRPGGTIALWGYTDAVFPKHLKASEVMWRYARGTEPNLLGGYWGQPGRDIIDGYYKHIIPPEQFWEDVKRVEYRPALAGQQAEGKKLMSGRMKIRDLRNYVQTWSAYHKWEEKNPGVTFNVLDMLFEEMRDTEEAWKDSKWVFYEDEVEVEWGTVLLMARRR